MQAVDCGYQHRSIDIIGSYSSVIKAEKVFRSRVLNEYKYKYLHIEQKGGSGKN